MPFIEIDIHGMDSVEAKIEIDSILKSVTNATYQIRIIHGFNKGTSLKNMIYEKYRSNKKIKRIVPGDNLGITILILREL